MSNATSKSARTRSMRLAIALMVVGTQWPGCAKEQPAEVAPAAPAGTVEAVQGRVTAQRADGSRDPRVLAVAAQVFADDTISTPADGAVSIRLLHNLALWQLQGGLSKRVDQSAAWKAPKNATPQPLAQEAPPALTASAGRHSEREAAQTAESAQRSGPAASAPPAPLPPPAPQVAAASPPSPAPIADHPQGADKPTSARSKGATGRAAAASPIKPLQRGGLDDGDDGLIGAGSGLGKPGTGGGGEGAGLHAPKNAAPSPGASVRVVVQVASVQPDDPALAAAARRIASASTARLSRCFSDAVSGGGTVPDTVHVTLEVDSQGQVTAVTLSEAPPELSRCLSQQLRTLRSLPGREAKVLLVLKKLPRSSPDQ